MQAGRPGCLRSGQGLVGCC